MHSISDIEETVLKLKSSDDFNAVASDLFHFQYEKNILYRDFCKMLPKDSTRYLNKGVFPFLPIRFFKQFEIKTGDWKESFVFTSSGTTGSSTSRHFVKEVSFYEQVFLKSFTHFYGDVKEYVILALLPSYLEREGSSLVYMCEKLIQLTDKNESGFYLNNTDELINRIKDCENKSQKTILIGVSFALLDLAEKIKLNLKQTFIMETGGMKGRKKEITRDELHAQLKKGFGVNEVHSEYGMTELFSQAYSKSNGRYFCPPQMKIIITAINDPFEVLPVGLNGRINIIDLANMHTCAFLATDDLGKINEDGSFEISGRIDYSDVRGCNLLFS